jgi:hypothetical protein
MKITKMINVVLDAIACPKYMKVRGRDFTPKEFFSPRIAQNILLWRLKALGQNLAANPLDQITLVANKYEPAGGMQLTSGDEINTNIGDSNANTLIYLAEAADLLMEPARLSHDFDYGDFLMSCRESIERSYKTGELIPVTDQDLNFVFAECLFIPANDFKNTLSLKSL